jgi:carbonic anhydrase
MLRAALGAGASLAGAALVDFASVRVLDAQTNRSPADAVQELIAGNQRCVANQLTSVQQDLAILRSHTAEKQEPFAAVLACADSRVPVELIFDQTIGPLFVARVAGNLVTPEIIASLEYAVAVLGVKAILVLGHSNCGAVKAAIKAETVPGQISAFYPPLHYAVEHSHGDVARAIEINAGSQAELLRTSSTVIRDAVRAGEVSVASGVYDLSTGTVSLA